jgi:hypothetical protein
MKSQEELTRAVLERSRERDGRKTLTCAQAFEIAARMGVEVIQIGRICNQQNVRLCGCQLGCFS